MSTTNENKPIQPTLDKGVVISCFPKNNDYKNCQYIFPTLQENIKNIQEYYKLFSSILK